MEDRKRYYNWYHGYTQIDLPYNGKEYDFDSHGVNYHVNTAATIGTISTQYYGEKFYADKVDTGPLMYTVRVYPPDSVKNNKNVTLHFDVKKVSLKDLSSGQDRLSVCRHHTLCTIMETSHKSFEYPLERTEEYFISLERNVNLADVRKQNLSENPGIRFSWDYSGMEVKPEATYRNYPVTEAFVRNCSNNISIYPNVSRLFSFN